MVIIMLTKTRDFRKYIYIVGMGILVYGCIVCPSNVSATCFVVIALYNYHVSLNLLHNSWLFRWLTVCSRQTGFRESEFLFKIQDSNSFTSGIFFTFVSTSISNRSELVVGCPLMMKFTQKDPGNERIRNR